MTWAVVVTLHYVPQDDLIRHELSPTCPCAPAEQENATPDGTACWMFTHSSLDGRELHEPKSDPL